jgi:AcrR family transcriptional regulator
LVTAAPDRPGSTTRARAPAVRAYRKGNETKQRILHAALREFGEHGYESAATRRIAAAAGLRVPALSYYFGGKEGLYCACAVLIVDRFVTHTSAPAAAASAALDRGAGPAEARAQLTSVMGALAHFLLTDTEGESWVAFVDRERRDPGPAFDILYTRLWAPGIDLTARLIAAMRPDAADDGLARMQALLLIGSLIAFHGGRHVSARLLGWQKIGDAERRLVLAALERQISALVG